MASPFEPLQAPRALPEIPVTVNWQPEPATARWLATTITAALTLGLPEPRAFAGRITDDNTPEVLLSFDGSPTVWDDLTEWANHHGAEVTATDARDHPAHYYAHTTFTRACATFTCSAYIPAHTP
jgi:hypothetical protein